MPLTLVLLAAAPLRSQSVRLTVPEENFRKEPVVTTGNRLATVLEGTVLALAGRQGRWSQVALEGWIWKPSVSPDTRDGLDLVVSKPGGENLRERPDAGSRRLAILERGMLLDSVAASGNWVRVRRTAWIWSESVTETTAAAAAGSPPEEAAESVSGAEADERVDPSDSNAAAGAVLPDRLVIDESAVMLL
ncbi:MAG: SH3 domain-containing protein, partial [marine benthic group bacterium]|nr:SH3 domain-containing protein [Gemmatimonadota bacterium]